MRFAANWLESNEFGQEKEQNMSNFNGVSQRIIEMFIIFSVYLDIKNINFIFMVF